MTASKGQALVWEVWESRVNPGSWYVEGLNPAGKGQVRMAVFSGPEARERAEEYAAWKRSAR